MTGKAYAWGEWQLIANVLKKQSSLVDTSDSNTYWLWIICLQVNSGGGGGGGGERDICLHVLSNTQVTIFLFVVLCSQVCRLL